MTLNYDDMPWLVTTEDVTYGPLDKDAAVALRDVLRAEGQTAEAWAAQAPDPNRIVAPPKKVAA